LRPNHPDRGRRRSLTVAFAAVALILAAPAAALASWPQFQGNATHDGLIDGPAAPLRVAWTNRDISLGGPDARGGLSAPVVAEDGTIVVVAPTAVLGFSPEDGSQTFEAERDFGPSAQPAVAGGADGPIVVFTEGYGDEPPASTASPSPSPASGGDEDAFDSHVNAIDLDGEPVWDEPVRLDAIVQMPVAVDGDTAYVGDVDGGVTAVDVAEGTVRWSADVGSSVAGAVTPDGDRVYVTALGSQSAPGAVVALDASSGTELWRTTEDAIGSNVFSAPVLADDAIVVLEAGSVVALGADDGVLAWQREIVNPLRTPPFLFQATATPAPVLADGSIYVVDVTGRAYALDAGTGEIRWDHALNDPSPVSPPLVADEQVVVATDSGTVDAIDRTSGRLVWTLDATDRGTLRGLADAGDTLVAVAGTDDAELIAFGPDEDAALVDEPSPTTFDLGRLLAGYALGALVLGAAIVAAFTPLQRRMGPAVAPPDDVEGEAS
jgi:outer membrane protein assembly factor BamB